MNIARGFMASAAILALAMTPAVAQETRSTMGRSVRTLARVPLKSRDGAPILLGSRVARGRPTLIAIWASWCGPCYGEALYLNRIRQELGGRYNFIYVKRRLNEPDPEQPPADVRRFLAFGGMADVDYVVADVPAYRQILGTDVGNVPGGKIGIPRVYLFDRHGRQIYATYGFSDAGGAELERRVREAVE
jgi:thiol-disulfide isomerase/thioredoxin